MRWLKRLFQPKIRLVPILGLDTRSYQDKWEDEAYLKAVISMQSNEVFGTEALEALKIVRMVADSAKTPEELAGLQKCIRVLHLLLTSPERAKRKLEYGEKIEALNAESR